MATKEGLVSKVIKIAIHIAIDVSVTDGPWRIQLHYFHDYYNTFLTENLCFLPHLSSVMLCHC